MGIFDKAKEFLADNPDKVDQKVEKAGDFADERTGGKYADQVDKGQETVTDQLGGFLSSEEPPAPVDPADPAADPERPAL